MFSGSLRKSLGLGAVSLMLSLPAVLHAQAEETPDTTGTTYTESLILKLTGNSGAAPGSAPQYGSMIQASDGNYYGPMQKGGANGLGAVFQLTPAGVYTLMDSFAGGSADGEFPEGALVQATDGYLYGTTLRGGPQNSGSIYRILPGAPNTPAFLHFFVGGTVDGLEPNAGLVQATDGYLYGTAEGGGSGEFGIVFRIQTGTADTLVITHAFVGGANDGSTPEAGLVQATDGFLYGTTHASGHSGDGILFKMPTGAPSALTIVHPFKGGATDAASANTTLIQATDGFLYGTSSQGGGANVGVVYKVQTGAANNPVIMHSFAGGTADGSTPHASLVEATDGALYSTTYSGGASGDGAVFNIQTGAANTPVLLHSFTGGTAGDGANPYTGLLQGTDGSLYGATYGGGTFQNMGILYKIIASPALAAPVQLTVPASVVHGTDFTLSYLVTNAFDGTVPGTLNDCFATNTAGDTTGWTGAITGEPTSQTKTLTAPEAAGAYTYALTCGGSETGIATLNVTVPLTQLTFSSVTHNFGSVSVGANAAYGSTITNTGAVPVSGSGISITGSTEFTSATNCPASLAVGAHCQVTFTFAPTAAGSVSATWQVSGTGPGTTFVPSNGGTLTGSGTAVTGNVTLTSDAHNWGTVPVGTTSAVFGVVLTNGRNTSITLTLGSVTAPFASATNCPATLAAGATCNLQFTFTPSSTSLVQQVYSLSANGGAVPITAGGVTITGITLTGN